MQIEVTKGRIDDGIRIIRDDGSVAETRFPKKGPFPHDLVHVAVETAFGFRQAFWGKVAGGYHPEEINALAASLGHASAGKAHDPDPSIIELIQAERLVECFEAEIWGGPAALEDLQAVAEAAFFQSRVPRLQLGASQVEDVRQRLAGLQGEWNALPPGGRLRVDWPKGG